MGLSTSSSSSLFEPQPKVRLWLKEKDGDSNSNLPLSATLLQVLLLEFAVPPTNETLIAFIPMLVVERTMKKQETLAIP